MNAESYCGSLVRYGLRRICPGHSDTITDGQALMRYGVHRACPGGGLAPGVPPLRLREAGMTEPER